MTGKIKPFLKWMTRSLAAIVFLSLVSVQSPSRSLPKPKLVEDTCTQIGNICAGYAANQQGLPFEAAFANCVGEHNQRLVEMGYQPCNIIH